MARPGVYVTESVLPTPVAETDQTVAAGAMIAELPSGLTGPILVTSWFQFTRLFGGLNRNYPATFAANMFFRSGGRELYVSRVTRSNSAAAAGELIALDGDNTYITFQAKSPGTYGNSLRVRITRTPAGKHNIEVLQEAGGDGASDDLVVEAFRNVDMTYLSTEVTDMLSVRSRYIRAEWAEGSDLEMPTTLPVITLVGGTDGIPDGTLEWSDALDQLATIDRMLVLFSPGQTSDTVVSAMVAFAESHGSFVVLDTDEAVTTSNAVSFAGDVADSIAFAGATAGATSYAAVYYPHVWVADPTSRSRDAVIKVAPSGGVAGMILGTDAAQGTFKAPAGTGALLPGTVAVERSLTSDELDTLNNDTTPINAIRVLPGIGAVVMGARTLNQTEATRYISVRRTVSFLNRELRRLLDFTLFENNDSRLWSQIANSLDIYLTVFWQNGGLKGASAADAFYVKVDAENNTPEDAAAGIVNVEVGVALQYPAEFIKVTLSQQTLSTGGQ